MDITGENCTGKSCGLGKHIGGGHFVCPHNNLESKYPKLTQEWDYDKNDSFPRDYLPGSHKEIFWKCPVNPCGCHRYSAIIKSRTLLKSGCPYCTSQKVCIHNSIYTLFPKLADEWCYESNNRKPWEVAPFSNQRVTWKCKNDPCGCHKYQAVVYARVAGNGCPFCWGKEICPHNSLSALQPEIAAEWDFIQNVISPDRVSPQAHDSYHWICKKNPEHKWFASPHNRVNGKTGCPMCALVSYSKAQIKWIQTLEQEHNIKIQHALSPGGEFRIPGFSKVDGFHKETNTVFQYHGDYWHGSPLKYSPDSLNMTVGKSFQELYNRTVERDLKILLMGYNLLVVWETPNPDYMPMLAQRLKFIRSQPRSF